MLPKAGDEIGCYANVKRALGLAREDIDAGIALEGHRAEFAAKWILKQVQDDALGRHQCRFKPTSNICLDN